MAFKELTPARLAEMAAKPASDRGGHVFMGANAVTVTPAQLLTTEKAHKGRRKGLVGDEVAVAGALQIRRAPNVQSVSRSKRALRSARFSSVEAQLCKMVQIWFRYGSRASKLSCLDESCCIALREP